MQYQFLTHKKKQFLLPSEETLRERVVDLTTIERREID